MIDRARLLEACRTARDDLIAERTAAGHWVGELSNSALSTATAVSAISVVLAHDGAALQVARLRRLVAGGLDWLVRHQNDDGGFGDTDKSFSNIATSMLVRAAFQLAGAAGAHADLLRRLQRYIERHDGAAGLRRRYGRDKTFAVPILTNDALAGFTPWREVAPLPFELACLPHGVLGALRLPVVSYAIPALVAIGQARYFHAPPRNPITWAVRRMAVGRSLAVLERKQPASGGFLEATPLTSFVVMSLAAIGRVDHPVVGHGLRFLVDSVRPDGAWPIDTNLATWVTTLAINALAGAAERRKTPPDDLQSIAREPDPLDLSRCLDWLLSCQHGEAHPFTHAAPGGWGWTDLSGAVPDADDTAGALLALAALRECGSPEDAERIDAAARLGVRWLVELQNRDGGWPTFCRGWGALPFDRSGADLTAHAVRALHAWRGRAEDGDGRVSPERIGRAVDRGLVFLARRQRSDGSWVPLWFGNQHHPDEENPVYGTARVLLAYRDLGEGSRPEARRARQWLAKTQAVDGGFGGGRPDMSSVEETAVAVEALLSGTGDPLVQPSVSKGLEWLVRAVLEGRHRETAPIGFYFAKLWYYERLYPRIFTASALGQAIRQLPSGA